MSDGGKYFNPKLLEVPARTCRICKNTDCPEQGRKVDWRCDNYEGDCQGADGRQEPGVSIPGPPRGLRVTRERMTDKDKSPVQLAPGMQMLVGELLDKTCVQPIRRAGPKVGRNDPCPCGRYGRKYKKCHYGLEIPRGPRE